MVRSQTVRDWLKIGNLEIKFTTHVVWSLMAGMRGKILDFNQRLEISIDVAHALTYLHLYSGEPTSY